VYPRDGAVRVDISYTLLAGARSRQVERDASTLFGLQLVGDDGQRAFAAEGFRGADGTVPPALSADLPVHGDLPDQLADPPEEALATQLGIGWDKLRHPGRFLVLFDISGSMGDQVSGTGRTKLQFAQQATIAGMQLVPPQAEIGFWEFSTRLKGTTDYRELVPVGPVTASSGGTTHLGSLVASVQGVTPHGDTGLYDTALAGFRTMRRTLTPGQPNVVVLMTDGRNDDAGSIDLPGLLKILHAEQDPQHPVRFLTLGFGADADQAALTAIAAATGGSAHSSPNPADISSVFFKALAAG
jgi:Ca-activated chloride channel family protein